MLYSSVDLYIVYLELIKCVKLVVLLYLIVLKNILHSLSLSTDKELIDNERELIGLLIESNTRL